MSEALQSRTPAQVLAEIIERQAVCQGEAWLPLHSHVSMSDGAWLQQLISDASATQTLEVGMAYGISTLFVCDVLRRHDGAHHVVIDPFQSTDWRSIGIGNIRRAHCDHLVEFHEERSEFVLPRLASEGRQLDFAFIDGWHSFEQALLEFYYIDRMLRVGGILAFDDADWPSINKLLRYLVRMPRYRVHQRPGTAKPPTLLGRARVAVGATPLGRRLLHPHVQQRNWDLGLTDRCVALRKVAAESQPMTWFTDF